MSQKEAHSIHLIERKLDANCRECLIARVRTLRPEWRVKSASGGYHISDSTLTRLVMRELLELKGIPMNDPDHGFETAFTVLGFKPSGVEEIELMPTVDLPGIPETPYSPGQVELDSFAHNLGKTTFRRPAGQTRPALLLSWARQKLRGIYR